VVMGAGGILFEYDGDTPAEHQPMTRPSVVADVGSGTGQTGTFSLMAIYQWVDRAGRLHRSAPSAAVSTGAIVNKQIDVYVSIPPFAAYDASTVTQLDCELYITDGTDPNYYLARNSSSEKHVHEVQSLNNYFFKFTDVLPGVAGAKEIYSTGDADDELTSEPAPAMRSIASIGDRIWGIDAEDTSRIWFTKPMVAGYAPEWNTACTLVIGDDCVAITDVNGTPTVFAKSGIWQIYGEGPNSLGAGSFAPARKLPHQVECVDSTAVCKTPQGVMFRGRRGLYLLGTGLDLQPIGLPIDPETRIPVTTLSRLVYDETHNEVRLISSSVDVFVYNLLEGKWSVWLRDEGIQYPTDACVVDGSVWYVHLASGPAYRLRREMPVSEGGYRSTVEGWSIQTPKIKFAGVMGDVRVWDVYLQIKLGSALTFINDLTVSYATPGGTDTFTWTGTQLSALGSEGDIVDLRCPIRYQTTKSFQVTVTETVNAATTSCVPIALRIEYGVTPGAYKRGATGTVKGST
jgi:hypothetical protein